MAAKTWHGQWWEHGGGGTPWDAMAYDPDLNLLYVGTGNGAPWNRDVRSPGGGDNLFLASILALNPDTGRMKWYYQTTPGDTWDFNSVQSLVLAELNIAGKNRKVIMQAPKNGFFFVIDRESGEFLSAEMFTPVNWASGFDKKGRPIETPNARYPDPNNPLLLWAGGGGAHNWQPMSYSPITKLVYLPGQNRSFVFGQDPNFKWQDGKQNFSINFSNRPKDAPELRVPRPSCWLGTLCSRRNAGGFPSTGAYGGTMATAGNLVFHGEGDKFIAYDATSGTKLWETTLPQGFGTPVTYELDGMQYVSVLAGSGARGRLYTFALDGKASMPELPTQGGAKGKAK